MRDFISTMPNEIIGNILSRLTMKEAGRTSVLSTTWRYQWTHFSGVVDFDHSLRSYVLRRLHVGLLTKCIFFVSEWEKFMARLEHVMKSLKCPSMQGLRVCMDLGNPRKLPEWLKFASERNVQVLDLDFTYHFTEPFYGISDNIRNVLSSKKFEMKSLRVLRLACVDVNGEVLQCFLATCPLLETIRVTESTRLVRLKVWGQGLRLKHLELVECNILYLDICAENLMTFRYSGDYGKFNFESVPSLEEASFGGRYASYLQANMHDEDFFGVLLQVHVLKLNLSTYTVVSN
uniref:F-box/FBD/LRR-repeat protein At1g13570 family n=1 Tax=Cajanus cajan TaxID=3821 RepID=A0A151TNC5_CAJCA|nr:F-box/FBD/LRR-repeat protein At1g13570 family [Cajanus cajan]